MSRMARERGAISVTAVEAAKAAEIPQTSPPGQIGNRVKYSA